ncbi:hypothetical protein [Chryseobacterium mulctrae]|uniref:hypothetical protein n=1 Tax=Chryseobacterium mulctrae TaxID=2576777 RepID=UPI00111665A0|nr:hypothetical protein [Chryseobacterium mulctrae]
MLTLLTSGIENIEVSSIVNNIFQSGGLEKITSGVKGLGYIALVFYFVTKITAVFSGSEQITPKLFGPPLIYAAILLNWNTINSQLDSGLLAIQQEFQTATPKDSKSTAAYQNIISKWSSIPSSGVQEQLPPTTLEEDSSFFNFSKIKDKISTIVDIMNNPEILILKTIMFFTHVFNTVIIMLFNAFSYIWINLLRIGGIVALALYFFPTFKGTFTNWLRTYISVYLWIPVGSIMIYVSDQIFLAIVAKIGNVDLPSMIGMPIDPELLMKMTFLVISALATTILKLILLSKVPNVIGYWLGGGNSGDMFSAAPTMVMMSTSVAGSAANAGGQVASGVLTGGASAAVGGASAAGGIAGKAGESLKG